MAPVSYKAEVSTPVDSVLPSDYVTITPHLSDGGTPFNAQAVADKLRDLTKTYLGGAATLIRVRLYRDGAPKPNYPVATSTTGAGALVSAYPRELALCLSFYSQFNRPRQRGRVYIPAEWMNKRSGLAGIASRPSASQITTALDYGIEVLKPLAATVGANWTIWSPTDRVMRDVTNYYVDDEWDIIRSRGRPPTTRQVGTIP